MNDNTPFHSIFGAKNNSQMNGKRIVREISFDSIFPQSAVDEASAIIALQENIMNLKENNFDTTLAGILMSKYVKKPYLYTLTDTIVTATYVRAQNLDLIVRLTEKLIQSQSPENSLVDLKNDIITFIFKSIASNLQFNRKRVAFLIYLRKLVLDKIFSIDDIYLNSVYPIKIETYTRYFFPEFVNIDPLIFSNPPTAQLHDLVSEIDNYYQENSGDWENILSQGFTKSDVVEQLIIKDDVTALQEFISDTDFDVNTKAHKLHVNPLASEYDDLSLLNLAALFNSSECFNFLIRQKAEITNKDFLSLECAIRSGNIKIISELENAGASFKDKDKATPVRYASAFFRNDIMNWIFAGKIPEGLPRKYAANDALDLTCDVNNIKGLNIICDNRVNIQHKGEKRPGIVSAAENGHIDLISLFALSGKVNLNDSDAKQRTALYVASEHGFDDIVSLLMAHGADVNARLGDHRTPLIISANNGYLSTVQELVQLPQLDPDQQETKFGKTAFMAAIANDHFECAKLIASLGTAKLEKKANNGMTPFIYALMLPPEDAKQFVQLLLQYVPPIDIKTRTRAERTTPFQFGICQGQIECVRMMKAFPGFYTKMNSNDCELICKLTFDKISEQPIYEFIPKLQCIIEQEVEIKYVLANTYTIHTGRVTEEEKQADLNLFSDMMRAYSYDTSISPIIEEEDSYTLIITEILKPKKQGETEGEGEQKKKSNKQGNRQAKLNLP